MRSSWHEYFLGMAVYASQRSKDPSTRVGAVIVGADHQTIATGYNGPPRGAPDDDLDLTNRDTKLLWTEHAERNAIYCAASLGHATRGATIYITHPPCSACARGIVQAGITRAVFSAAPPDMAERWKSELLAGQSIMLLCGVEVVAGGVPCFRVHA